MDTNNIVLEKQISVPPKTLRTGRGKWQRLIDKASVGDSFTIPIEQRAKIHGSISKVARVTTRKVDERTIRIWILEKYQRDIWKD